MSKIILGLNEILSENLAKKNFFIVEIQTRNDQESQLLRKKIQFLRFYFGIPDVSNSDNLKKCANNEIRCKYYVKNIGKRNDKFSSFKETRLDFVT